MFSTLHCAVILLVSAVTFSAAQSSCGGRCGTAYYRGFMCQCDYGCLSYGECCEDFEFQCTTKNSCKGRCGEGFKRGRLCSCDSDCFKFNQCCSDFRMYCDAEEPTLKETTDASEFSEGNNEDDSVYPPVPSYPDDLGDDMFGDIFPEEEFPNDGVDDPEASPIPESTSGFGSPTADLLDQISTEPTQDPDTLEFRTETFTVAPQADNEASGSPSTVYPTVEEAPSENTDAGTTIPQATTTANQFSNEPTPTSEPQTGFSTTANVPELETEVQPEDDEAPTADPTVGSSDKPEVITPASVTPDQTPEATTSNPEVNAEDIKTGPPLPDLEDPSISVTPAATGNPELDALTTHIPSSTDVVRDDTTETPGGTTAEPLNATPDPTKPTQSEDAVRDDTTETPGATTAEPLNATPDPTKPTQSEDAVRDDTTETPGGTTAEPLNATPDPTEPTQSEDAVRDDTTETPGGTTAEPLNATPDPTKPTQSEDAVRDDTTETPGETTAEPLNAIPDPTKPTQSEASSKPQDKPEPPKPAKPSPRPETKPLGPVKPLDNTRDYQADDANDTNLCSGRPVGAVTTLRNGTIVVFRGHYFWFLDRNRVPGPAHGITQVWGVPSPIDTAFTRCNCQGKTYIFKGPQYWRYENDVLEAGYPRVIQTGFDGLRGHITAALSVPQYQRRRESVYFFKRGGSVQQYSYKFGTSPTCGKKPQYSSYTVHNRIVRQAVSLLGPTVNIRTSWPGFPSTITAAVSVPSYREPERYKYHVFSRTKSYNVRMGGQRPVIAAPAATTSRPSQFIRCPKKV